MKTAADLHRITLKRGLSPIEKLSVSEWAEKNRRLPSESAEPGRWRTSRVPYMRAVMDAFTDPAVEKVVVKSASQIGKALDVSTPIATPDGWTTMGEIAVGDRVFDETGEPCKVLAVSEIFEDHVCYEMTFSDGAKLVADAGHRWRVDDLMTKTKRLVTTEELAATFRLGQLPRYSIPPAAPLLQSMMPVQLPVEPYLLGRWLGAPDEAAELFAAMGSLVRTAMTSALEWVAPERRIPMRYLRAAAIQRMDLLRGFCDADYLHSSARTPELDADFEELWQSTSLFTESRQIVDVRKVATRPTRCIAVDSKSHLFLAGQNLIPTHNSEVLLNVIGRFAQVDPCTMMLIQPTLELAVDFSKSRLAHLIGETRCLKPLFYGVKDVADTRNANQTLLSKFYIGGRIVLAGANSPAGLASRPIRILLCDEVDRFPPSAGSEGDPLSIAAKRCSTYWNRKIGLFSTPTVKHISRIDVEYELGTQEEWRHQCPNCGEYHTLEHRQITEDCRWRCPDCGMDFDERTIKAAPQKYVALNEVAERVRSFFITGLSSPWITWREIMKEWAEAKGKPELEKVVYNTRFGLSYEPMGDVEEPEKFESRLEKYDNEVPRGVLLLTAGVDVQIDRLEYEVVGWGEGEESWGICRGQIMSDPQGREAWLLLDEVLDREYKAEGGNMVVRRTFIDSGFLTTTVYSYCRSRLARNRSRYPIKGYGGVGRALIMKTVRAKGGIPLTLLGVNEGKMMLYGRLSMKDVGPQYCHFGQDDIHLDRRYDETYFRQLNSEHRVVRQKGGILYVTYEPVSKGARTEALDMRIYAMAAMKSFEPIDWEELKAPSEEPPPPTTTSRSVDIWQQ